jgi:phage terminase large subunit-like protein
MDSFLADAPIADAYHPDYLPFTGWLPGIDKDRYIVADTERKSRERGAAIELARIKRARNEFGAFMEYCFFDPDSGEPFRQQWFHDEWSAAMSVNNRLIIVAPRDHGKTTQIVGRVIWELGRNPNLRIKIVCASDGRAKERLFEVVQHLIYNKAIKRVFPGLEPADQGEWSKHKVVVKRTALHRDASVEAIGITSTATGGRADLLIADDVVDRRNALSFPALREQIKQAWKSDWTNLLEPNSRIWYICTLWHKDDLSHELMENPAYTCIRYAVPDDFGALWPDKWHTSALYERYLEIGSVEFNRGFRNIAIDLETAAVKPDWFTFRNLREDAHFIERLEGGFLEFVTSYDTAGTPNSKKEKQRAQDYAAEVVFAADRENAHVYVIDGEHYRDTVKGQAQRVVRSAERYKPFRAIVEKASQAAVDEWVLELAPWMVGVLEVSKPTQKSKMERLMGVTPLMESGRVTFHDSLDPYKKNNDAWKSGGGSLYDELVDFPFGRHDDLVDGFSQGLHAVRRYFLDWNADGGDNMIEVTVGREGDEESEYLFD